MNLISEPRFTEIIKDFNSLPPILVLGDVGIDKYTYGNVSRISPEAPVPVLEVTKEWLKLGLAANVSDNFDTLGVKSTLLGTIGDDLNGDIFLNLLKERSLSPSGIVRIPKRQTIFKERVTTNTQQICRIDYESSVPLTMDSQETLFNKISELERTHGALLIEDYGKGTLSKEVIQKAIKLFRSKGKLVTVDPSRTSDPLFYEGATLFKPNFQEAKIISGVLGLHSEKVEEIAFFLLKNLKLDSIIITLGSEGMAMLSTKMSKVDIIPTVANEVFDVSGAGDTAISAITASLLAKSSLEEAAWIGNCASGVVVSKKGTATVNIEELTEFYDRLRKRLKKKGS